MPLAPEILRFTPLVDRMIEARKNAHLHQVDIHRPSSIISRTESYDRALDEKVVRMYEQALENQEFMDEFRSLQTITPSLIYDPPDDDDFQSETRLLESRVVIEFDRNGISVSDHRHVSPLASPLAGMRLRNSIPKVNKQRPDVHASAIGAEVVQQRWLEPDYFVVDVQFPEPLLRFKPAYQFTVNYRFDRMAPYFTETPEYSSEYFSIDFHAPRNDLEIVESKGMPLDLVVANARAFLAGEHHSLTHVPIKPNGWASVKYRNLRPSFAYGIFWKLAAR